MAVIIKDPRIAFHKVIPLILEYVVIVVVVNTKINTGVLDEKKLFLSFIKS